MQEQFITLCNSYTGILIFLYTWLFISFEPLQDKLTDLIHVIKKSKIHKIFKFLLETVYEIIVCHKCLVFWTTLIITLNLPFAILISFFADYSSKK